MKFKDFLSLFPATYTAFGEDKAPRLAAALSYFTLFSIAPLLIICIALAAIFFGEGAARAEIINQINTHTSVSVGETVKGLLENASKKESSTIWATVLGIGVALMGASGFFGALQDSLNTIWGVAPKPNLGLVGVLRARFVSFTMVLGVGFLLLVSLMLTTVLSLVSGFMTGIFGDAVFIVQIINFAVGFLISTLLFAAIYKILPDAEIQWRDVWFGALATSILFTLGRYLISIYLSRTATESTYGSAGGLVVLLLWVNYASLILFFGAEFTKVYANKFGSKIVPSEHAIPVTADARARQGLTPRQSETALSGAGRDIKNSVNVALNRQLTREQMEATRKDFEFTLAAVAGGVIAALWFLRRR